MDLWQLPTQVTLNGRPYAHRSDFRDILRVLRCLNREERPVLLRWLTALVLFYEEEIPEALERHAMEYLARFLTCGEAGRPGPRLFDWERDAGAIIADVNKVAAREVRSMPYLHWWTFLSYFHGISDGQLSVRVGIRDKLRRGKKLEPWEQEYYRAHKDAIVLRSPETPEQTAEKQRLLALLEGK